MPRAVTKQLADRWSLIKTHIHKPWGITKRALKPQLKPPTARNLKALYIHLNQLQTRYIDTPKITHSYSDTLCYYQKAFLYWLWHRRHCGRHHTGDHLEGVILQSSQGYRWRPNPIWTHSQGLMILASSVRFKLSSLALFFCLSVFWVRAQACLRTHTFVCTRKLELCVRIQFACVCMPMYAHAYSYPETLILIFPFLLLCLFYLICLCFNLLIWSFFFFVHMFVCHCMLD